MTVKGVDVAYPYQGDAYDTTGLSFAFVKATQGNSYVNPHQAAQLNQATKHGLVPGVYLFMQPGDTPKSQAEFFQAHGIVRPGTMIAVDWEALKGVWPSNKDKDELLGRLMQMYPHNKVGLYTNVDGWTHEDHTNDCGDFLWIASPGTAGKPHIQDQWTFHQYGESNNVDLDVADFATLQELKIWAGYQVTNTTNDPTHQPGFPNWAYKNPMGAEHQDAWGKLNEIQDNVKELKVQVAALTELVKTMQATASAGTAVKK